MRIGIGYDVHRLVTGRKLIIGGVEIPFEKGLDGHSDADVLIHSIIDSLLGAAGLGDIGRQFPDTDKGYKNISSMVLLGKVYKTISDKGYSIINIDAVVIAQKPKLSAYIESMEKNICLCLGLNYDCRQINIKATTQEKLGFTGRGEGISAEAVCLLRATRLNNIDIF